MAITAPRTGYVPVNGLEMYFQGFLDAPVPQDA